MESRFVLSTNGGQFVFSLKTGNGETILTSQHHTSHASALAGVEAVRANAPLDARYHRRTSGDGAPYFVLLARNHEVLGTSASYPSAAARERGIYAVKSTASVARLDDET